MREGLLRLFSGRPWGEVLRDVFDILIVAYVIYRALLILRGTRAMQMGVGLGFVFLGYLFAKALGLVTLLNILTWLLSSIILIVIVVFQNDIRRALIRMGGKAWLSGGREQQSRVIDEVVAAATELARHRMGALIAFEQDANVLEFCKSDGVPIDAVVTRELLVSLFVPEPFNKLHDGAVLIRDLKIARAGVFFPMPEMKILDASLGSRHRAALGITEETDAVVVVVSEERGTISFCFSGNIVSNLDGQSLRHALLGLFGRAGRKKTLSRKTPAPAPARQATPASVPRPSLPGYATPSPPTGAPLKTPPPAKAVTAPMRPSQEGRVTPGDTVPARAAAGEARPAAESRPTSDARPPSEGRPSGEARPPSESRPSGEGRTAEMPPASVSAAALRAESSESGDADPPFEPTPPSRTTFVPSPEEHARTPAAAAGSPQPGTEAGDEP